MSSGDKANTTGLTSANATDITSAAELDRPKKRKRQPDILDRIAKEWPAWLFFAISTSILYFLILLFVAACLGAISPDTASDVADIGNSFGLMNTFISGLALFSAVYAVLLQRRELSLQRVELRAANKQARRSADAHVQSISAMTTQTTVMENEIAHGHNRFLNEAILEYLSSNFFSNRQNANYFEYNILGNSVGSEVSALMAKQLISSLSGFTSIDKWLDTCNRAYPSGNDQIAAVDCEAYLTVGSYIEGLVTLCEIVPNSEPPLFLFCECMRFHTGYLSIANAFDEIVRLHPNENILLPFDARKIVDFTIRESARRIRKNFNKS